METKIPIGLPESQRLEFKAAAALRNLPSLAREVVAFLNAGGGQLWVGLTEHDGIATAVDPIHGAEQRRKDLLSHLLDVIRPSLASGDIDTRVVRDNKGQELILVEVLPRTPVRAYYFRKDGGRFHVTRVDHRIRPMTDDEIQPGDELAAETKARKLLRDRRDRLLMENRAQFWLALRPGPEVRFEIQTPDRRLDQLLQNPSSSGNRIHGFNFRFPGLQPAIEQGRMVFGDSSVHQTMVDKHGGIEFVAALSRLNYNAQHPREIYPLALLECVTSIARLAAKIYALPDFPREFDVLIDLAMIGIEGWTLPAYPPESVGHRARLEQPGQHASSSLLFDEPKRFSVTRLRSTPDEVGFQLVREVYEQFNLREDCIPSQYDRERKLLLLTD